MKLILNKYCNLKYQKEEMAKYETLLSDIVVATQVGFIVEENNKKYLKYHVFCYHYSLDKHVDDGINLKKVSFDIIEAHPDTQTYCFSHTNKKTFTAKKSINLQIENALFTIPQVSHNMVIEDSLSFKQITDQIKEDLLITHKEMLKEIKKLGYTYEHKEMKEFTQQLKHFINQSYSDLFLPDENTDKVSLYKEIREYDYHVVDSKIPAKNGTRKQFKI